MIDEIKKTKKIIFLIINLALSIVIMGFAFSLMGRTIDGDMEQVSLILGLSIASVLIYQIFLFIRYQNKKDRIRITIVSLFMIAAMISAFLAKNKYIYFFISTFLLVISLSLGELLKIVFHNKEKTMANILTNILLGTTLALLGVFVMLSINETIAIDITTVDTILLLFIAIKSIILPSFKLTKIQLFLEILFKTHTLDVLICLLALIVGFSLLFPKVEPTITNYWDAMWYCFTVITTIGFGDFYATSALGRVLTVVLGIYGIVVVAILTSVIVNYYNTISKKEKDDKYMV